MGTFCFFAPEILNLARYWSRIPITYTRRHAKKKYERVLFIIYYVLIKER